MALAPCAAEGGAAGEAPGGEEVVGVIVCKQDVHRSGRTRGYIAMLAVHHSMRKRGMGSRLVSSAVLAMRQGARAHTHTLHTPHTTHRTCFGHALRTPLAHLAELFHGSTLV